MKLNNCVLLSAIVASNIALANIAHANSAPVTTDLSYQFVGTSQQAFNDKLLESGVEYQPSVSLHTPVAAQQHLFSLASGISPNLALSLDYRLAQQSGTSGVTLYRDALVTETPNGPSWTGKSVGDSAALVGLLSDSSDDVEHSVFAGTHLYFDNVTANFSGNTVQAETQQSIGGRFDIAFDGNKDQLQYSLGLGYDNTALSPQFDSSRDKTVQVIKEEADGEQIHDIYASQALTIAFGKNTLWRFGGGVAASVGYLSDPEATISFACGVECSDDAGTSFDESAVALSGDEQLDYRTERLPDSRIGWHVHSNLRQYFESARGALQLDLRYAGNNWDMHQGMAHVAWAQRLQVSTDRSVGFMRWLEKNNTHFLLEPFSRVSGQLGSAYFSPIADPELIERLHDEALRDNDNNKVSGIAPNAAISTTSDEKINIVQQSYHTANPKYANFLTYSFGLNSTINIADVSITSGVESYAVRSDIAGQQEIPGLAGFVTFNAGLSYKF